MHFRCRPLQIHTRINESFCFYSSYMPKSSDLYLPHENASPKTIQVEKNSVISSRVTTKKNKQWLHDKINSLFNSEISSYLDKTSVFPIVDQFLKRQIKYNFVVDISVAKDIANKILENTNQKSIIIEGNPGFGLITHQLLESGVPKINIFDHSELKAVCVNQLQKEYSERIEITNHNLFEKGVFYSRPLDAAFYNENLGSNITLVGVIDRFVLYYLSQVIIHDSLKSVIPMEFYFICQNSEMTDLLNFRHVSFHNHCLFTLIFQCELLSEYSSEAFLAPKYTDEIMCLFKITRKPNPFENIDESDMLSFVFFLKILGKTRSNFILPTLEKWLPDCGPYLIANGISMTLQTRDLRVNEAVTLFKLLKKLEGFETFKSFI